MERAHNVVVYNMCTRVSAGRWQWWWKITAAPRCTNKNVVQQRYYQLVPLVLTLFPQATRATAICEDTGGAASDGRPCLLLSAVCCTRLGTSDVGVDVSNQIGRGLRRSMAVPSPTCPLLPLPHAYNRLSLLCFPPSPAVPAATPSTTVGGTCLRTTTARTCDSPQATSCT